MRSGTLGIATIALGMTLLAGCVSWVSVKKLDAHDKDARGLRYSLAAPYLLMKPKPDGTVTYEWLFLPDSSKRYAVTTHSFLANNTLEFSLEHGILKKIVGKPDSSAVASTALTQAGSVLEAQEKARQKAAETETTAAKAEADKIRTALATAEATERTAALELAKASATVEFLRQQTSPDAKALAEAGLAEKLAIIDHDAAVAEVTRIKALLPTKAAGNAGGNTHDADPNVSAETTAEAATAWGPLLFRVVQHDNGKVTLRAVNLQTQFDTYGSLPAAAGAGPASTVTFTSTWDPETKTLLVEATQKVELIANRLSLNHGTAVSESKLDARPQPDGVSWKIAFDPPLDSGQYTLRFEYQPGKDKKPAEATTTFDVK